MLRRRMGRGRVGLGLGGAFPSFVPDSLFFFFFFNLEFLVVWRWCGVGGEGKIDEDGQSPYPRIEFVESKLNYWGGEGTVKGL